MGTAIKRHVPETPG